MIDSYGFGRRRAGVFLGLLAGAGLTACATTGGIDRADVRATLRRSTTAIADGDSGAATTAREVSGAPGSASPGVASSGSASAAPESSAAGSSGAKAARPQDYSPEGLFASEHSDFLAAANRYEPSIRFSFSSVPSAEVSDAPGDFDETRFLLNGTVPIVIDPDTVALVGGLAESRDYEVSANFGAVEDTTVGAVGLHLGAGHFFNEDTYGHVVFSPGVYSDFDGTLKGNDWQFFGEGLVTFRYHDALYLKGGIEVSQDFRDVPVFPLLGLAWLFAEDWRVDVLAPRYAELTYEHSAATSFSAGIELEGQQYFTRSSAGTGNQELELQVQEIRIYLEALQRFNDNLSAFGRFGSVVGGDNKFFAPGGQRIEGQIRPAVYFQLGVGWDF